MNIERLSQMVNDIANYFAAEPDHAVGVASVADHLRKFWTPRMCEQLAAHVDIDDSGLDPLAAAAVRRLAASRQA